MFIVIIYTKVLKLRTQIPIRKKIFSLSRDLPFYLVKTMTTQHSHYKKYDSDDVRHKLKPTSNP